MNQPPVPPELKHKYVVDLNPGTSRHVMYSSKPIQVTRDGEYLSIRLQAPALVRHEGGDHADIWLPIDVCRAGVLQEYNPWADSFVPVFD